MAKLERKEYIVKEAYKLFLVREYDSVTTVVLEQSMKKSRGSIFYWTKNKEGLFRAVVDKYIFEFLSNTIDREVTVSEKTPFLDFIKNELAFIAKRMKAMSKELDKEMISSQYLHLYSSACNRYKGFQEEYEKMEKEISAYWGNYYDLGVKAGEIREDIDKNSIIKMFRSLYYGDSFITSVVGRKLDVKDLEEKYLTIYQIIKK